MSKVVEEVYAAKNAIRKNRSLIFRATFEGDVERARQLLQMNKKIRDEIIRKYAVIID